MCISSSSIMAISSLIKSVIALNIYSFRTGLKLDIKFVPNPCQSRYQCTYLFMTQVRFLITFSLIFCQINRVYTLVFLYRICYKLSNVSQLLLHDFGFILNFEQLCTYVSSIYTPARIHIPYLIQMKINLKMIHWKHNFASVLFQFHVVFN